jgi:hypothetical protein
VDLMIRNTAILIKYTVMKRNYEGVVEIQHRVDTPFVLLAAN